MTSDTNWYGGGGGGGRISIWEGVPLQPLARSLEALPVPSLDVTTNHPTFQGAATVSNGTAYGVVRYGEPGTVTFVRVIQGMIFIIH